MTNLTADDPKPRARNGWREWTEPVVGHPYRTGALIIGTALLLLMVYLRIVGERVPWRVGDRAPRSIRAHTSATYIDSEATERAKTEARNNTAPVFKSRIATATRETREEIERLFELIRDVRLKQRAPLARSLRLRDALPVKLSEDTRQTLSSVSDDELAVIVDMAHRLAAEQMKREIRNHGPDLEKALALVEAAGAKMTEPAHLREAAVELAQRTLRPNTIYDPEATARARKEAEDKVEPQRRRINRGELIIAAGDTVEQVHIDMLRALGLTTHGATNLASRMLAAAATIVALLTVFGYYLYRFRPHYLKRGRCDTLLMGSFVMAASVARLGANSSAFEAADLATVTALAIVLTVLLDCEVAILASIFMAFFAGMATPASDPRLIIAAATAGVIAAFASGAGGSRPTMTLRTALVCTVSNTFLAATLSTVFGLPIGLKQLALAGFGGSLAALFAAGAIVILERPLRIATEVRLLELSSANEPILKRLALEAPGTYASSIGVANLAEAAADAIGADALLVRVGAYYHDIGKLKRPYYYIENQQGGTNPHDRLTPRLSARVIISHVRDGLELADEIGLPTEVRAFIAEHHGTTLVEYFHERALQEAGPGAEVSEAEFQYPGPKPRSRESGIVMLADTVEAASRTLSDPTAESIRTMVRNLIRHKIDDGQLDECSLTFADIHAVEDSFVRTLSATFHRRIKYPEHLEDDRKPAAQPAGVGAFTNSEAADTGPPYED